MNIAIETKIAAELEKVWQKWTTPEDIEQWNAASDDWHCPHAEVDLKVGGMFLSRMEAKDGSMGFDFRGTYTVVEPPRRLVYKLEDGRQVRVECSEHGNGVLLTEQFDADDQHTAEQQRAGWQAILDRFKSYVEQS